MANLGRPPKPAALRLKNGAHPSKVNMREPRVKSLPPECPPGVSLAVRDIWNYTVDQLAFMQIAAPTDRDALLCYCVAVVNHRESSALIERDGLMVEGQKGNLVRHPALIIQKDAASTIRHYAQEFGLTPSARARIEVKGTDDDATDVFSGAA